MHGVRRTQNASTACRRAQWSQRTPWHARHCTSSTTCAVGAEVRTTGGTNARRGPQTSHVSSVCSVDRFCSQHHRHLHLHLTICLDRSRHRSSSMVSRHRHSSVDRSCHRHLLWTSRLIVSHAADTAVQRATGAASVMHQQAQIGDLLSAAAWPAVLGWNPPRELRTARGVHRFGAKIRLHFALPCLCSFAVMCSVVHACACV